MIDPIFDFAQSIAGIYDNFEQSQNNPRDFARINIIFRPLPWDIFNKMYDHCLTDAGLQKFNDDWAKLQQELK